jgi:hypothetical protein
MGLRLDPVAKKAPKSPQKSPEKAVQYQRISPHRPAVVVVVMLIPRGCWMQHDELLALIEASRWRIVPTDGAVTAGKPEPETHPSHFH